MPGNIGPVKALRWQGITSLGRAILTQVTGRMNLKRLIPTNHRAQEVHGRDARMG